MPKIKKLPLNEAQKIAAGEVVERPANVVKELIENSIDANATSISIYLEDGGKKLIRIVDNGCGMSKEDSNLCFEQYATSKINTVHDLESISSHGFRGEALASISAVSHIELITQEKNNIETVGTKLLLTAGKITKEETISSTPGTDITIKNLFFNIPARQKFLKKKETEQRQITHLMNAFCLDYLDIHFKYFVQNREIINCPAAKNLIDRITQLWDHHFSNQMIPIETGNLDSNLKISGAISNHQYFRYDRNNIFLFVNKRWIKDQKLSRALLRGYENVLPPARYPAACIFIEIDPKEIDINIHPRKEEVQFLHPRKLTTLLQSTVKAALEKHLSSHLNKTVKFNLKTSFNQPFKKEPTINFDQPKKSFPFSTFTESVFNNNQYDKPAFDDPQKNSISIQKNPIQQTDFVTNEKNKPIDIQKDYNIVGQYKKTYILLEHENGLFIIDQHAAHERILYEKLSKNFQDIATVKLMFPEIININTNDMNNIINHIDLFKKNGIEIEPFGENQLVIQSTPVHIKNINLNEFVKEVASWISEEQNIEKKDIFKILNEKMRAQMACKAAIKAGDILNQTQMEQLLNDLYKTDNRLTCPHGRPTGWLLSIYEIEKRFKRKC